MRLSSRTRYGMRAMLELAIEYGRGPVQIKTIAEREDISNKYLEQLIAALKGSGFLRSLRGPRGGYVLDRPPEEINLLDIFTTLEGPMLAVDCLEHPEFCPRCSDCATRLIWSQLKQAIESVLEGITLRDLSDRCMSIRENKDYQI